MSEYEGLSLAELLQKMHDLALPVPVSEWPETAGWWVLGTWLLAMLILGVLKMRQHRVENRYRREALQALKSIDLSGGRSAAADSAAADSAAADSAAADSAAANRAAADSAAADRAAAEIASVIKRCALSVYPRQTVASLYGDDWAAFLIETGGNDSLIREAAPEIARATSDPDVDAHDLLPGAERWIRRHRG